MCRGSANLCLSCLMRSGCAHRTGSRDMHPHVAAPQRAGWTRRSAHLTPCSQYQDAHCDHEQQCVHMQHSSTPTVCHRRGGRPLSFLHLATTATRRTSPPARERTALTPQARSSRCPKSSTAVDSTPFSGQDAHANPQKIPVRTLRHAGIALRRSSRSGLRRRLSATALMSQC